MISSETLRRLELEKVFAEIAENAHSDITKERLLATAPFADPIAVTLVSGRIEEIRRLESLGIGIRISAFDNILPILERVRPSGALLPPVDLLLLIPVLQNFKSISSQLTPRNDIPLLNSFDKKIAPFPEILEPLEASIENDGSIKDDASPQLREIRRGKRALAGRIRKKIEEIVRDSRIEIFLQDDFFITQRSGRWVIPVRMDSKGMVKGVVHDVSSSGETAFMEPLEIIPFVNELENLTAEEKAEEIRILRELLRLDQRRRGRAGPAVSERLS